VKVSKHSSQGGSHYKTIAAFPAKGSSDAMSHEQTDLMEPLRSLLDAIPQTSSNAIIATDRDCRVRFWNPGATRISVLTPLRPRIDRSASSSPKSIEPGTGRVFTMPWPPAGAAMAKARVYRCPR
jgi:hypothetical protein